MTETMTHLGALMGITLSLAGVCGLLRGLLEVIDG